jgi:hypothetical protein
MEGGSGCTERSLWRPYGSTVREELLCTGSCTTDTVTQPFVPAPHLLAAVRVVLQLHVAELEGKGARGGKLAARSQLAHCGATHQARQRSSSEPAMSSPTRLQHRIAVLPPRSAVGFKQAAAAVLRHGRHCCPLRSPHCSVLALLAAWAGACARLG